MNWMNKEDRKLINELNQKIANHPRLFAQKLAMQTKLLSQRRLLQAGAVGFIVGVFLTTTGFYALNFAFLPQETTSSRTQPSEPTPKLAAPSSEQES